MGSLAKIRILEVSSSIAAAYCARQFALWGAEVITVADGWNKSASQYPTYSMNGNDHSLLQESLHIGKRVIEGAEVTTKLIESADVLITDRSKADLRYTTGFADVSQLPHRSVVGKVQTPAQLLTDPQLQALGFLRRLHHPRLGKVTLAGPPARMSATPAEYPSAAKLTTSSRVTWSCRRSSAGDGILSG